MAEADAKKVNYSLIIRLVLGIVGGIAVGSLGQEFLVRILTTFSSIFGSLLGFSVPLIILAFITVGISGLGNRSGKILGVTVGIAYCSSVLVGLFAFGINSLIFPNILTPGAIPSFGEEASVAPFINFSIPPIMGVTSVLVLAFILGVGLSKMDKSSPLKGGFENFNVIIADFINKVIIPLLPIHIAGVFASLTYTGKAFIVMSSFAQVFGIVILLHIIALIIMYIIAGAISKKNPVTCIRNMMPAYLTAIGTQSSAATIPVTVSCIKNNGVKGHVAEFVGSLCATIHLSGSTITLTSCALATMILSGHAYTPAGMIGFIFMLGIIMVAAPGIPGGAVVAAMGILQSVLGFSPELTALMIALYLAQDSFGTACNVTGDGAIALVVDTLADNA
ncbi:MAG: dicarboxylate/amino acid:cation symporter [Brevinema sp.]